MLRARPAPDESLEDRLAALDRAVREAAARKPGRDARADAVVRDVNDLVDGLEDLSSKLTSTDAVIDADGEGP